jgi:hypothetical protein
MKLKLHKKFCSESINGRARDHGYLAQFGTRVIHDPFESSGVLGGMQGMFYKKKESTCSTEKYGSFLLLL